MRQFKCKKCGCENFRTTKWKMSPKSGGKTIKKRFAEPSRRMSGKVVCRKCNHRQWR